MRINGENVKCDDDIFTRRVRLINSALSKGEKQAVFILFNILVTTTTSITGSLDNAFSNDV